MINITVTIKGENMTEVVEKANEFIADGYRVENLENKNDEGTISLIFESEVNENERDNEEEKHPGYRQE